MRINQLVKTLFAAMVLSASLFTACDNSGDEVVTPPTVGVTKGEATATSLTFEIKAVDADKVSYMLYLATESTETIFASGKDVTNMVPVVMTETELTPETEYAIIAAASNTGGAVVSTPIVMTTLKAPEEVKNPELTLVAGDGAEYEATGGEGAIEYEIKNGVDGTELKAEADAALDEFIKNYIANNPPLSPEQGIG